jgi:predicted MFS family arabinose efflux permease
MKMAYMLSFLVFIIGSVVAATAPNSTAFIIGRAVSGLGSAGVFAGSSM